MTTLVFLVVLIFAMTISGQPDYGRSCSCLGNSHLPNSALPTAIVNKHVPHRILEPSARPVIEQEQLCTKICASYKTKPSKRSQMQNKIRNIMRNLIPTPPAAPTKSSTELLTPLYLPAPSNETQMAIVPEATAPPTTITAALTTGNIIIAPGAKIPSRLFLSTTTISAPEGQQTIAGVLSLTSDGSGEREEMSKSAFQTAVAVGFAFLLMGHLGGWVMFFVYGY